MLELTLYTYFRSSCSYRVRIGLGYKGLAWKSVAVDLLAGDQRSSAYTSKSPTGYVPCLVVDGVPFVESMAILELLEELVPDPPLLPKPAADRARVRALAEIINAGTQPLQNLAVLDQLGPDKERRVAWMRHFMAKGLGAFEALVQRFDAERGAAGRFSFGDAFTLADALLVPQVYAARRQGVELAAFPRIARVEAALMELPFVQVARPEAQDDARP